jgi:hypothetical protein
MLLLLLISCVGIASSTPTGAGSALALINLKVTRVQIQN